MSLEDDIAVDYGGLADGYTPGETHPELDEADEELASRLKKMFDAAYEARAVSSRDWELYWLYLKGDQLVIRNKDSGEIVRITAEDSKRLRSQFNISRPTARSLVGKLSRSIPTCVVVPASADFNEQNGARVAEALLQWARRKEDLDTKYVEVNEFLPWAGNGILELTWNNHGGRRLAYCMICSADYPEKLVGEQCPRCQQQRESELSTQQAQHQAAQMDLQSEVIDAAGEVGMPADLATGITPEDIPPPEMMQQGPLPLNQEPPELEEIYEGDFEIFVRDVRDFFPEPGAKDIRSANWVFCRAAEHVATARQNFPEAAEWITAEANIYTDKTADLRSSFGPSVGTTEFANDHVYVYTYQERPTELYPKGRTIYKINDRICRKLDGIAGNAENPYYILGRFPYYHFGFDRVCGEFWFDAPMANAHHRQKEINELETDIREHTRLGTKPKIIVPVGSRITQEEITAATDQIIKYNPMGGGKPDILVFPPLSQQVFQRKQELVADVRLQFGVTAAEGGAGPGDTAGRALAIVEAEADQQVGPTLVRNHAEWRELHRGILLMCQAYLHPKKLITVSGPEGLQTFSFEEMVLSPGWDLQIEQEDGLSRNPAVRLQQTMDLANVGAFNDPMTGQVDTKKLLRAARVRMPGLGYDTAATESAAASQIPYLLQQGIPHVPKPEDDPAAFATELLGWLRGPGRKMSPNDPEFVEMVRQIWQFYASWAVTGQPPPELMAQMGMPITPGAGPQPGIPQNTPVTAGPQSGGPGMGGPDQSAPGGSTNNPGHMGSDLMTQARQSISSADQRGESEARMQQKHEG